MTEDRRKKHIVSIVLNGVVGDSRVIKTAKAAEEAGYSATIVGMGSATVTQEIEIEGVSAVLIPNPAIELKKQKLWPSDKERRSLGLLVEAAIKSMLPVVRNLNPDLLHSHDMLGIRVGSAITRILSIEGRDIPWVHDLHEYVVGLTTVPTGYRTTSMEYERRYIRQADHLITVSDTLARTVADAYKLRREPTVVYNAPIKSEVEAANRDVRSDVGLPPEARLAVYIGVAKKERGCETIVRAVAKVPNLHICFVSNSEYVSQLQKLATSLEMSDRFHSVPYVPSDAVAAYIRTADVGTHGLIHYPNGEVAMPNKMFEYLQAGLPMVVSDVTAMKEFVEGNGIGASFVSEDVESCAEALVRVLSNSEEFRAAITDELKEKYAWQKQSLKIATIYEELLARNARDRKTLFVTSGGEKAEAQCASFVQATPGAAVGVLSKNAPRAVCDFYWDTSCAGDQAGFLSRIANKYDEFVLLGGERTLSLDEIETIRAAGKSVAGIGATQYPRTSFDAWQDSAAGPTTFASRGSEAKAPDGSLLQALEQARLQEDEIALARAVTQEKKETLQKITVLDKAKMKLSGYGKAGRWLVKLGRKLGAGSG